MYPCTKGKKSASYYDDTGDYDEDYFSQKESKDTYWRPHYDSFWDSRFYF